mgnify:CR=1 FL=1
MYFMYGLAKLGKASDKRCIHDCYILDGKVKNQCHIFFMQSIHMDLVCWWLYIEYLYHASKSSNNTNHKKLMLMGTILSFGGSNNKEDDTCFHMDSCETVVKVGYFKFLRRFVLHAQSHLLVITLCKHKCLRLQTYKCL